MKIQRKIGKAWYKFVSQHGIDPKVLYLGKQEYKELKEFFRSDKWARDYSYCDKNKYFRNGKPVMQYEGMLVVECCLDKHINFGHRI